MDTLCDTVSELPGRRTPHRVIVWGESHAEIVLGILLEVKSFEDGKGQLKEEHHLPKIVVSIGLDSRLFLLPHRELCLKEIIPINTLLLLKHF